MTDFTIFSASRAGSKHDGLDGKNQDAFAVKQKSGTVLLAVCDGAGSRPHSRIGAECISKLAMDALSDLDWDCSFAEQARLFISKAKEALADRAKDEQAGLSPDDLACTVLAVAVTSKGIRALQIGDGFIVVRDSAEDDYRMLFTGSKGEYANETVFVTHKDAESHLQIYESDEPPVFLCLSSDGVERQAIKLAESKPHAPFFEYLAKIAAADVDRDAVLRQFLAMPSLDKVTDDDRTLVCAVRKTEPIEEDSE